MYIIVLCQLSTIRWLLLRFVITISGALRYGPPTCLVANGGIDGLNGLTASEETFAHRRHTVASLMLMAGANPKVVSKALGHSPVGFTWDTYGPPLADHAEKGDGQAG